MTRSGVERGTFVRRERKWGAVHRARGKVEERVGGRKRAEGRAGGEVGVDGVAECAGGCRAGVRREGRAREEGREGRAGERRGGAPGRCSGQHRSARGPRRRGEVYICALSFSDME
jgi:hypothetical protein